MDKCRKFTLINTRDEFLNFIILWFKQVGMLKLILANLGTDAHDSGCKGNYDLVHWLFDLLMGRNMHLIVFVGVFPLKWHIIYCNTLNIKCAMNDQLVWIAYKGMHYQTDPQCINVRLCTMGMSNAAI